MNVRVHALGFLGLVAASIGVWGCEAPADGGGESSSTGGESSGSDTGDDGSSTQQASETAIVSGGGPLSATLSASTGGEETGHEWGSESTSGEPDGNVPCEGPDQGRTCENPSTYAGAGECDPFAQDCPEGTKCLPWANDGGGTWNATTCRRVPDEPAQLGEACTASEGGAGGVDTCDVGLMCWDVDAQTDTGYCIELCGCGPADPLCSSPGTVCSISNSGSLPLCIPTCDGLDPDSCPEGQGCYKVGGDMVCAPDASGLGGEQGDPCEYVNACGPGLYCANAEAVPDCSGSVGCCTALCDLDDDDSCAELGTTCYPLFAVGDEPEACHVDTGVCVQ